MRHRLHALLTLMLPGFTQCARSQSRVPLVSSLVGTQAIQTATIPPGDLVGLILDSVTAQPLSRARFSLFADAIRYENSFAVIDSASTASDSLGRIFLHGLRSGSYTLWVVPPIGYCGSRSHVTLSDSVGLRMDLRIRRLNCATGTCTC